MKIVLIGSHGQLGRTLLQSEWLGRHELVPLNRDQLDITDERAVRYLLDALQPEIIINAAAYTAVDAAETDDLTARAVNASAAKYLGSWTAGKQAWLLQLSTDFVFCGRNHRPYTPGDQCDPVNIYGRTKLEGELHVRYLAPHNSLVLRTSWVYAPHGRNFVRTMLGLMQEKSALRVVDDQWGVPTSTDSLSRCIEAAVEQRPTGILHWRDAGLASWYDFAIAIQDEALRLGLLQRAIAVEPVPTTDYPTPAKRPPCAVLDHSAARALGCQPRHWRRELVSVLEQLQTGDG